ncbi:MAG: CoA ester lyase, partial [Halobacteria archaeon]|nr:CoA ester lyase [Halobacteria archaeon]
APGAKDEAREKVRDILSDNEIKSADPEVCVRVNPLDQRGEEDVVAVTGEEHEPSSIVLPKVGSSKEVEELQDLLSANGSDAYILALIETARGVINSPKIAEVARVDALIFGAEDLSAELGATRTPEGTEVLYAREKVVTAATASGIDAIDTLHTDFRDTEGLREDTEFGIQLGFDGKLAIHPSQVGVINDAFTPDGDRVEWAERVLKAKEEAENKGKGVFEV